MTLNKDDLQKIDELIADRLEAEHIVSIFTTMDERQKEILTQALMPFVRTQKPPLRSPENFYTLRWTQDDADVNTSVAGSSSAADQRGFQNPTLPRWLDMVGGSSWLDPDDPQIVHFRAAGGGGADCMWDWLVSECWADEVAAGRGEEGQRFTSLTGCPFYVTSTIQNAWDGVGDGLVANGGPGGAKDFTTDCTVFLCPGGDIGQLAISSDNLEAVNVIFWGADPLESVIPGTAGAAAVSITDHSKPLYFNRVGFGLGSGQKTIEKTDDTSSGSNVFLNECIVGGTGSLAADFSSSLIQGTLKCVDTHFEKQNGVVIDLATNGQVNTFYNCVFSDCIDVGTETTFEGCTHNLGSVGIGIRYPATNTGNGYLNVKGSHFRSSGNPFTHYIHHLDNAGEFHVVGCTTNSSATATSAIRVETLAADAVVNTVVGNTWGCDLGLSSASSTSLCVVYVGNSHNGSNPQDFASIKIVEGEFDNSTFAANAPAMHYIDFNTGSFNNMVNGVLQVSGAPTHTGNAGMLAFDDATNTMYVNTADEGTTWGILGVSGGGGAAGSGEPFVTIGNTAGLSAERALVGGSGIDLTDGGANGNATLDLANLTQLWDQTGAFNIVQRGGNLIVANSQDLEMYSDNSGTPSSLTGEWDAATGHIGIGTTASAGTGLRVVKTLSSVTSIGMSAALTASGAASTPVGLSVTVTKSGTGSGQGLYVARYVGTYTHADAMTNDLVGLEFSLGSQAGAGAPTNVAFIDIIEASWSGSPPSGSVYGLRMGNLAAGTAGVALTYPLYLVHQEDSTAARSYLGDPLVLGTDQAPASGTLLLMDGAITLDEMTAPGTPAADEVVIYNETDTDALKAKIDTGAVYKLNHKHTFMGVVDSATASTSVPYVLVGPMPEAGTIVGVYSKAGSDKTCGATAWIGDIHKIALADANTDGTGTTIFSTKPTITNGNRYQAYGAPDSVTTFAAGDWFALYTDQSGTNLTDVSMTLEVRYT